MSNKVKLKIKKSLTVKYAPWPVKRLQSILPSNNFRTHTSQERERATHTKPMPRRKERVPLVKPRTSPLPTALPLCLKLIITAACSLSFEALDWSSSSLPQPPPCSSSPPPLDLVTAASRSTPLDQISISFSIYSLFPSVSHSFFLPLSISLSLRDFIKK